MRYKGLEDQLSRSPILFQISDRLAAVGQLASRVAHEIRNPLGIFKATAQLAKPYSPQFLIVNLVEIIDDAILITRQYAGVKRNSVVGDFKRLPILRKQKIKGFQL